MKPHLPILLLASLLATVSLSAATNPGNIVFVGDSITQGGTWAGAGTQASYRYSFFKNMVDQGLTYTPMGIGEGSSTKAGAQVGQLAYRGTNFENVHEAAASARSYTWSGIPANNAGYNNNPATRANEAPVWNLLGLTNPQTETTNTFYNAGAEQTYTGPTYESKYGTTLPDTVCIMIGINDLIAVKNGTQVTREDGTTSAYTYQDVIANTKSIVDAYQQYNPDVNIVVMGLLPTAPNNATYGLPDAYNALLQEAAAEWSTEASTVTYADVSTGLSNTNHYDTGGAHPNNQGELIVAGNLANTLGVGQRTLGLTAKSSTNLTHRVNTAALSQAGVSFTGTTGETGPGVDWSTFNDTNSGVSGLLIQAGGSSTASMTVSEEGGWNVDFSTGFTLQTSVQLYEISGNALFMRFGDGIVGDGLLRITDSGVYWGTENTLLFEGAQTSMNDFRIVYMPSGSEQLVDAGYYVWRNNQLIGEALAAGNSTTDALTIGSGNGSLTYAGIADVAWDDASWATENSASIAASKKTALLPSVTGLTGDALVYNNTASDLNTASAWSTGQIPSASDTIRFDQTYVQASVSLSAELAVQGAQFETSSAVKITSNAAGSTLSVGNGGITVSDLGSNVFIQHLKLTDAQTWNVGVGKFLTIGTAAESNAGSLTTAWSSDDHTVTIQGGGTVVLATAQGALQDIDWKVTDGSVLKAIWSTAAGSNYLGGLGSGQITLDNGTLAVNYGSESGGMSSQGNWNWGNDIAVGNGGGTIKQCATSGNNRWLNLSGSLSLESGADTTATLTFTRENTNLALTDQHGFILSGDNSAFTGKIVIDASAMVRVGAAATSSSTLPNAGTLGTLHSGILETNGTLTLTRTDSWTVGATLTGTGTINIGSSGSDMNTADQRVTLTGECSGFTGTININQGVLVLGNVGVASGLSNASAVAIKANGTLDLNGQNLASNVTLGFTSGGKITNTSGTASKITLAGTGVSSNIWTNATVEAAEGSTIQLEVSGNHVSFNGKLSGSGTIEKILSGSANARHLIIRSSGNEFDGKLIASQGWLILDSTNNAQTFAANYRPDLEIAAGASFTVGDAYTSEASALKLGNVTGSGNFTADYGNGMHYIDVQIDQSGGATFNGAFQLGVSAARNYSVIKRGGETWTLTGTHTATGFLKAAEGDVIMQGTWAGSTEVNAGASMTVSGSVGQTEADRTHTVQQGGVLRLTGSGEIRNNSTTVSVRENSNESRLENVTVTSSGIARTSASGEKGAVSNATITLAQAGSFGIENVRLANSLVDLTSAGSVTLDNVILGSGSSLRTSGGGSYNFRNSTVELSSASLTSAPGTSPVTLSVSMNAAVEGTFTLNFTQELMSTIGAWESGPYNNVRLTLTDVTAWAQDTTVQFSGGDTLFCDPRVENVTFNAPTSTTGGTVIIDIAFGKPIPEPASAALGLLGFSGLLLRRRRKW